MPPTEKLTLSIFPTPAWPVKSPLIRRFGEETAMGTYLKYARHRSFSPKPPSERQFDRPRQKLASLVSEVLKKGQAPYGDLLRKFRLSPRNESFLQPSVRALCPHNQAPLSAIGFANSRLSPLSSGVFECKKKGGRFCGRLATMKTKLKLLSSAVCRECEDYCAEDCRHCRGFGNCRDCQHNRCRASNVDEVYLALEL